MLRYHASCGRCHRAAPAGTSAMRRAVDGAAPPLFLQVRGPRGAEEVARAHATATQTSCTQWCVETGRRWCPSRWSRRLVAVPDSSCLQRSSPGRCWSRRRNSLVRVVSTSRHLDSRLGRRDADGGRTTPCTLSPCSEWIQQSTARTYRVLTLNRRTSAMSTNSLATHV